VTKVAEEEGDEPRWYLKVTNIAWDPTRYLDGSDYLMGILLDIPEMYYVTPNNQVAFVYIFGKGMARVQHDFSQMDDEERSLLINIIRRDLS
jgi:hypothetical protein